MEYFRYLSGVSISVVVILILSPLLQVMGEEKLNNDTNESNTESVKNEGATDYTISIRTTGDNMTLYTDSKLIGKTPLTFTLKLGEELQIYGKDNKGDIVFKTMFKGNKTPSGILIEYNEKPNMDIRAHLAILGAIVGVTSGILIIYVGFRLFGNLG